MKIKNRELQKITKKEYDELNWEANTFHCKKHNTFWYAGGNQAVYCKDCVEEEFWEIIDKLFEKFDKKIDKAIEKLEGKLVQRYNNIFESSNPNEKDIKEKKIEMKTNYKIYVYSGLKTIAYKKCSNVFIDIPKNSISFTYNNQLLKYKIIEFLYEELEKTLYIRVRKDFFGKI